MRIVFSLLMDNTPGVLSRIAGLFTRRGYNIESITAGVTADPRFTRKEHVDHCWLPPADMPSLDWAAADFPIVERLISKGV